MTGRANEEMTGAEMVLQGPGRPGRRASSSAIRAARCCRSTTRSSSRTKVKHILVRHEQGAAHAAEGYARSTGKPGVVLVTSGPGATNAVTGAHRRADGLDPARLPHRPGADASDRHRRLPGMRYRRHHPALHQAQLAGEGRQRSGARPARGVLRRDDRPAGSGRRRHPQGRAVRDAAPISGPDNIQHKTYHPQDQGRRRARSARRSS